MQMCPCLNVLEPSKGTLLSGAPLASRTRPCDGGLATAQVPRPILLLHVLSFPLFH